ncbi:MAG: tetraacyldisaccharide 4'-kinase, partial [Aquificota bacterium]|nr:tetraacyldisaccharide 4'-kinase [Aquificota bacterium]
MRVVSVGGEVLAGVDEAGDEAYMMAKMLKSVSVVVSEDRFEGGKVAVRDLGADLILLDDGFQHRKLYRDLDIVLIKAGDLQDRLFPAGRLREPISSLRRADAVVLSYQEVYPFELRTEKPAFRMKRSFRKVLDSDLNPRPLDILKDKEVVAFCGLGDNDQFLKTLRMVGLKVKEFKGFPDHHRYEGVKLKDTEVYITTPKDIVKLPRRENVYASLPRSGGPWTCRVHKVKTSLVVLLAYLGKILPAVDVLPVYVLFE